MQFDHLPNQAALSDAERAATMADPAFGRVFTDHMVTIRWNENKGWHDAQVRAREPFTLDPASAVLHYAQEIFEGLKAYHAPGGGVTMFRPEENARRFNTSAQRMAMPELPEELFVQACEEIIRVDRNWVPTSEGGSLYLRPFMFANETFLGVKPASDFIFCVIACPVGAYFKGGAKPVSIWVSDDYSRAGPGGTGAAKCGGNYAASLVAQAEAIKQGCDQVVFLDAAEHKWVEELGGMNLFFVFDDGSMITPPLGTILPGITRKSVIQLAREQGGDVQERPYSIDEWRADAQSGKLREVFACGTAAVIAAVGEVKSTKGDFTIGGSQTGPVTIQLREKLTGIQRNEIEGPKGWVHKVKLDS